MKGKILMIIMLGLTDAANIFAQGASHYPDRDSSLFTIDSLLIYGCLLLILILFIIHFVQAAKNGRLLKDVYNAVYNKVTREYSIELNRRLNDGKMPLPSLPDEELQEQIDALQKRLFKLEDILRTQPVKTDEKAIAVKELAAAPKPIAAHAVKESTTEEVFYLSTPNSDGSFNVSSAQQIYRLGASIYEFRKLPNSNKATFSIDLRESSVKLALRYAALNIDPVCDAENEFNMNAKRIICKPGKEGQADLSGDKWTVSKKAKIFYES